MEKVQIENQRKLFTFNHRVGLIVGQVNSIELIINDIISNYYSNTNYQRELEFKTEILNNSMTLAAKINCVKNIATRLGCKFSNQNSKDFYMWKKIRNIVAHGVPIDVGEKQEVHMVLYYGNNKHEVSDLHQKFIKLQKRITVYLEKIQASLNKT